MIDNYIPHAHSGHPLSSHPGCPASSHTSQTKSPCINQIIDDFANFCTILDYAESPDTEIEMELTNDN